LVEKAEDLLQADNFTYPASWQKVRWLIEDHIFSDKKFKEDK